VANTHSWGNLAVAFQHKNYRTYQGGRFISMLTTWMYKIAVGWIVWRLTHSATWLGIFGFLDQAPAPFIMPLAGALADRMDNLKFMRVTQALLLVQAIALSLLDVFALISLPVLIVFTLVYGTINAAQQPAAQAILPNLMPKEVLVVAYGLNSVMFNVARFGGPMAAGALISAWGTAPAIFCNALGATIFSVCLTIMRMEYAAPSNAGARSTNMLGDVRDGLSYAVKHDGIGPTMAILSALSIMPFTIDLLLPSLADGVYHAGAPGLAWMTSIMALGAMTQAMLVARRMGVGGLSSYTVVAIFWQGVAFLALAFSGSLWMALVCICAIGFSASATRVGSMTLLQYSVDLNMRARVASFYSLITFFGPALGSLGVGALGDHIGMPMTMGLIAVYTLAVWAWAIGRRASMAKALEVEAQHYRATRVAGAE
jgi:MFS family permease